MSRYFPTDSEQARHTIFPGVHIATSFSEKLMISMVNIEPGAIVEWHSHPHEQCGMIISGHAKFFVGEEQKTLGPGDIYFAPGGVRHRVIALEEPVRVIDIFTPIREDYR